MIALDASGLTLTIERVHISPALDRVDHRAAEQEALEPGVGPGHQRAGEQARGEERRGRQRVGQRRAEDARKHARVEMDDAARFRRVAGVDQVVGAAEERVQVAGERRRGRDPRAPRRGPPPSGDTIAPAPAAPRARGRRRRGGRTRSPASPACPSRACASPSIARRHRVPAPENLIIDTPEQIRLEFALAGVGSRFLALAFDTVLQAGGDRRCSSASASSCAASPPSPWPPAASAPGRSRRSSPPASSIYSALLRDLRSGLDGTNAGQAAGRPPRDRRLGPAGQRLCRDHPERACASSTRCRGSTPSRSCRVLVTRRQQRLGDLAAGTVVVHERLEAAAPAAAAMTSAARHGAHRLSAEEIVLIEGFLRRREELDSWVRLDSARRIAAADAGQARARPGR